jgi:hypothetical protein
MARAKVGSFFYLYFCSGPQLDTPLMELMNL